jgi:hypothetical protein
MALKRSVTAKPACVTITTGFVLPSVTGSSSPSARRVKCSTMAEDRRRSPLPVATTWYPASSRSLGNVDPGRHSMRMITSPGGDVIQPFRHPSVERDPRRHDAPPSASMRVVKPPPTGFRRHFLKADPEVVIDNFKAKATLDDARRRRSIIRAQASS